MAFIRFATLKLTRSSSYENDTLCFMYHKMIYYINRKSGVKFFSQKAQSWMFDKVLNIQKHF